MSKKVVKKTAAVKNSAPKSAKPSVSVKKTVAEKSAPKKSSMKKSPVPASPKVAPKSLKKSPPKTPVPVAAKISALKKSAAIAASPSVNVNKKTEKKATMSVKPGSDKHLTITVGTPRLPGLRTAPGVQIVKEKVISTPKKTVEAHKLGKKEVQEFKNRLLEMRATNISNIRKKMEDATERTTQTTPDMIDQASDACDEDIALEIAATQDEQLQLISTALEKIDAGEYGVCIMCNEPISLTRLRLLPFVLRCKQCRDLYEKTRSRHDVNWALVNNSLGDDVEVEEVEEE